MQVIASACFEQDIQTLLGQLAFLNISRGATVQAEDYRATRHCAIDRQLHVEAKSSTERQNIDQLAVPRVPPRPAETELCTDADPSQVGKLVVIKAEQSGTEVTPTRWGDCPLCAPIMQWG
jgi:hypothetical protein